MPGTEASTPALPSVDEIATRAERVRDRILAAGGDLEQVRVVAVTKGFPPELATRALEAGLRDLGENYAQELLAKVAVPGLAGDAAAGDAAAGGPAGPVWHFIGNLQSNKVRDLAPHVAWWHTIDRDSVARAVGTRAPGARVLVQVLLDDRQGRAGCPPDDVPALVGSCRERGLDVRGLMAVGPLGSGQAPEVARPGFERLVALADELGLPERSIGMSGDLEVAVAAGATMVRVGTDLFGPRPPRPGRPA